MRENAEYSLIKLSVNNRSSVSSQSTAEIEGDCPERDPLLTPSGHTRMFRGPERDSGVAWQRDVCTVNVESNMKTMTA